MKYNFTDEQFIEIVKNSFSIREVLKKLNIKLGGNYRIFYDKIKELNINYDHFTGQAHLKGKINIWAIGEPLENILIKSDKRLNSNSLRQRLIKENILKGECAECHLTHWLGVPARLQLDHINGDNTDNRILNLRILCPNCHSQTPTFRGKNKKSKRNKQII